MKANLYELWTYCKTNFLSHPSTRPQKFLNKFSIQIYEHFLDTDLHFLPIPDPRVKRHRISDPDPQHCS
jgi:hypothetical protein